MYVYIHIAQKTLDVHSKKKKHEQHDLVYCFELNINHILPLSCLEGYEVHIFKH